VNQCGLVIRICDSYEALIFWQVLWSNRNLVQSCIPGDDVPRLAVSSSPQEWGAVGVDLFQRKQYLQAMECFERAYLHREVDVCRAYSLREHARAVPISPQKNGDALAKAAFVVAAEAFMGCAAVAFKDMERQGYFRIAGECYLKNEDNPRAAQAFRNAKEYTLAAQHYRKAGLFDDAIQVIESHREDILPDVAESIVDVVRLVYFRDTQVTYVSF
jgi:tetratricopeptide (TPR) repeat protein